MSCQDSKRAVIASVRPGTRPASGLKRRLHQVQQRVEADGSIFDQEPQRPDTDTVMSRFYVDVYITWFFIALVYLICLLQVFSKL